MSAEGRETAARFVPYARAVASRKSVPVSVTTREDMIQDACEGACLAVACSRCETEVPFAYVKARVDGAVRDGLRRASWESRGDMSRASRGEAPHIAMSSSDDLVERGIPVHAPPGTTETDAGFAWVEMDDVMRHALTERERLILTARFVADESQQHVGDRLGVTESRVCQIEKVALQKMRKALSSPR